jgi:hypothetical protein
VLEESSKTEVSQWGLEKINYVDFLGVKNFLSSFPDQNLDVRGKLFFSGQEIIGHF